MNLSSNILLVAGGTCLLVGLFGVVLLLGSNPPIPRPELGSRGLKRHRALQGSGLFPIFEPLIRLIGGWLRGLPLAGLRATINQKIVHAGDFMGLAADELLAVCLVSSVSLGGVVLVISNLAALPTSVALAAFVLGGFVPWFRLSASATERARLVNRALPAKVDLASLCMGAGLDFPGALRQIVDSAANKDEPIVEEFARLLRELELGYTRRRALESFGDRVPSDAVSEFVNSVVQAEEKGNPLSRVLTIQSKVQRMRRGVAGEEAAAKAALMLMAPTMVIFFVVVTLLIGPVVIRFMTGGG